MPAPYATHRAQIKAILIAWGMPEENAEPTADILSWADLHGVDSHGMSMLPGYDRMRRNGRAKMDARPKIVKETPISALVDGGGGLGHVPAHFAMQVAIDKAKESGMAIAAVRNSAHFGATGYYTLMAAKAGADRHGLHVRVQHPGGADLRQGGEARHRSLVVRRTSPAMTRPFLLGHGDDDRGGGAHPQQGERGTATSARLGA